MNWSLVRPDRMLNELARQYVRAKHAGLGTAFAQALNRLKGRLATDPSKTRNAEREVSA